MSKRMDRRTFVRAASAAGIAMPWALSSTARGAAPSDTLRHAAIGCGGMATMDLREIAKSPHVEIVALCDIDDNPLGAAKGRHGKAETFNDFRKMFDKLEGRIDSCNVTVPDHMHAPIAMWAVERGIHVYCQKPLTHELVEARRLRERAVEKKVVSQMGIQIHSHPAYRMAVRLVQDGAIGPVKEVHTWADRAWSNGGRGTPQPPPKNVHWDIWLGVAAERPWAPGVYHPNRWWSWMDFGTGNLGDMGCHLLDPVVNALKLGPPTRITAECDPPKNETWPNRGKVHYDFPKSPHSAGPIRLTWYDGHGHRPPASLVPLNKGEGLPGQGSILIGEKGIMVIPHWSTPRLYPHEQFADYKYPEVGARDHWLSFVNACRGEGKTSAGFDYAGPLTETVLLGNLAKRFPGQALEWNAEQIKVTNFADANQFTMRQYRQGWDVPGLSG